MSQVPPNDEMSQLLQTDAAQSVLEMGYQPKVIKKAIDIILQAEGNSHSLSPFLSHSWSLSYL